MKTKPELEVPPGLDLAVWARWYQYRKDIKKPIKDASVEAAMRKLAAFGADQSAVVENSIAESYQGLFPVKSQPQRQGPITVSQARSTLDAAAIAALQARRAACGIPSFRDAYPGERVSDYRRAQESAIDERHKRPLRIVK